MPNYLRSLTAIPVYEQHDENSTVIQTIAPLTMIPYTREKRRNGINWMEIIIDENTSPQTFGYIKKSPFSYTKCVKVKLKDDLISGFSYTVNSDEEIGMGNLFKQKLSKKDPIDDGWERVEIKRDEGGDNAERAFIYLDYDPKLVTVKTFRFKADDEFYLYTESSPKEQAFIEVDNLKGRKGYVLNGINTSQLKDLPVMILGGVIAIATVIGIIYACYQAGWIVFGKLLFLIGIGVAFVAIIAFYIVMAILKGIFDMIYKRF